MAYSQLGIVNLALRRLGVKKVTALGDDTQTGSDEANDVWEYIRDEVLESHDWKFAKVRVAISKVEPRVTLDCNDGRLLTIEADQYLSDTIDISIEIYTNSSDALSVVEDPSDSQNILIKLASTTSSKNTATLIQTALRALGTVNSVDVSAWTVTGNTEYDATPPTDGVDLDEVNMASGPESKYSYAYRLPSDFLRFATDKPNDPAVYPIGGYPVTIYKWKYEWPAYPQAASTGYEIESLIDGMKVLVSDFSASEDAPLYIAYIQRVTDVTRYSAKFINALAWRLAAELSFIIPESGVKFELAIKEYAKALKEAEELNESLDYLADEVGATDWEYAGR